MLGICVEASHRRGMGHLYRVLNFCESLIERDIPFRIFTNPNEASRKILVQRNLPFEPVILDAEKNDWQTELRDGQPPQELSGIKLNLAGLDSGLSQKNTQLDIYDPWKDNWTTARMTSGTVSLPSLQRSLVLRVPYP